MILIELAMFFLSGLVSLSMIPMVIYNAALNLSALGSISLDPFF